MPSSLSKTHGYLQAGWALRLARLHFCIIFLSLGSWFFFLLVSLSSGDICKAEEFPAKEFTIAPVCTPFSGCGSQRLDPDQQQQLLKQLRTVKNADCLAHPRVLNQERDQSSVFCVLTSSPGDS